MEENENPWVLNSFSALPLVQIIMTISSQRISNVFFSNNPLFSCIITIATLILLYFPHALQINLSPVLLLSATLLLYLLRLGVIQKKDNNPESRENGHGYTSFDKAESSSLDKWVACQTGVSFDPNPNLGFEESFVKWDVSAPLEVIYEAYEGEEDAEDANGIHHRVLDPIGFDSLDRYPSLSMYYPETDSDSSSDGAFSMTGEWNSPESIYFKWEEEDREGLLIEIALDSNGNKDSGLGLHVEEDNLIEIDISPPTKNDSAFVGEV